MGSADVLARSYQYEGSGAELLEYLEQSIARGRLVADDPYVGLMRNLAARLPRTTGGTVDAVDPVAYARALSELLEDCQRGGVDRATGEALWQVDSPFDARHLPHIERFGVEVAADAFGPGFSDWVALSLGDDNVQ